MSARACALAALLGVAAPAAALGAPVVIDVTQVSQEYDQWCWAATSRAALLHFGVDLQQCALAEYTRTHANSSDMDLGTTDCCVDATKGCNHWNWFWNSGGSVEEILSQHAEVQNNIFDRPLSLEEVQLALDVGRLIVVRWAWPNGAGHFLLVHGYDGSSTYYMDPWPGEGLKVAEYDWMYSGGTHSWATSLTTGKPSKVCSREGLACDDGDRCTLEDLCASSACEGKLRTCSAPTCQKSPCNPLDGECEPAVYEPDGTSCDDKNPCTTGDACVDGVCVGADKQCPASECLAAGYCSKSAGECVHEPLADGLPCRGGTCQAGAPPPQVEKTKIRFAVLPLSPRNVMFDPPSHPKGYAVDPGIARKRHAFMLTSLGEITPQPPAFSDRALLEKGVELTERINFNGLDSDKLQQFDPKDGKLVLKLVGRCPAHVFEVKEEVMVNQGYVIDVPKSGGFARWFEIAYPKCAASELALKTTTTDLVAGSAAKEEPQIDADLSQLKYKLESTGYQLGRIRGMKVK